MKAFRKPLIISLAALAFGAGAVHVQAAQGEPGPDRAHSAERFKDRMQKRAAELHDKLKLDASQEGAWNAYLEKMKPSDRPVHPDRAQWEKLSSPERMEQMLARMKEREQQMAQRLAATRDFYAVLTPEQRKVFDEGFNRRPEHRRHAG